MSIVFNWQALNSDEFNSFLISELEKQLKNITPNDFLGPILLKEFNIGSTAPRIQCVEISNPPEMFLSKQDFYKRKRSVISTTAFEMNSSNNNIDMNVIAQNSLI